MRGTRHFGRFFLLCLYLLPLLAANCKNKDPETSSAAPLASPTFRLTKDAFTGFGTTSPYTDGIQHMVLPSSPALANRLYTVDGNGEVRVLDLDGPGGTIVKTAQFKVAAILGSMSPSKLAIFGDRVAVLTTSVFGSADSKVFLFNPLSAAATNDVVASTVIGAGESIDYGQTYKFSDGSTAPTTTLEPNFPSHARVAYNAKTGKHRLFLVTSNLDFTNNQDRPGTILVFDVNVATLAVDKASRTVIRTSGYNPQSIESWRDPNTGKEYLIAVNSGSYRAFALPVTVSTPGSVDLIDVDEEAVVANVPLGFGAPAETALAPDGKRLFLGSSAYAEIYEVDLDGIASEAGAPGSPTRLNWRSIRDRTNPIDVPSLSPSFQTLDLEVSPDGTLLFALNFNSSELAAIDLAHRKRAVTRQELIRTVSGGGYKNNVQFIQVRPLPDRRSQIYLGSINLDAASAPGGNVSAIETVEVSR